MCEERRDDSSGPRTERGEGEEGEGDLETVMVCVEEFCTVIVGWMVTRR